MSDRAPAATLLVTAALLSFASLPFVSLLLPGAGACLADPFSELPVKLWVFDAFFRPDRFFGGVIDELRHPYPGVLNNPDMVGTLIVGGLNRLLGDCGAYNLLVWLQLLANGAAAWLLGAQWSGDRRAGLVAAACVALMPLLLVYCVAGAITDMLNVWPYLLSFWALRRGWEDPEGRSAWPLSAGALVALGFITCPYNAVVFLPAILPLGAGLLALGPERFGLRGAQSRGHTLRFVSLVAAGGLILGGPFVVGLRMILEDPNSQMAAASVESSRHAWPYHELVPRVEERYTAYLSDFVSVGPGSVVLRDNVARFYRAQGAGLVTTVLALLACGVPGPNRSAARLWVGTGLFLALAATGPFLPLTANLHLPRPLNPVWLALHHGFPGAKLLLEPFRYGLPAAACLGIAGCLGAAALGRRVGGWALWLLPVALVVETLTIAPLFRPMPTTTPTTPAVYTSLDEHLPPGAILELPFFAYGSKLFARSVFLHQRAHDRPLPHIVEGYPPAYLVENPATAALLAHEDPPAIFGLPTSTHTDLRPGIEALRADGLVGIVVTPALYKDPRLWERVERLLRPWGPPAKQDGRWIYRL